MSLVAVCEILFYSDYRGIWSHTLFKHVIGSHNFTVSIKYVAMLYINVF